ncbi:ketopantoate reductase family protein [Reyranella sp.]|uniref:ketopantoate reductase family protein n=1 Tax=Reyranella sp. TaxID=1929291 RepID=UPI003D0B0DB2
MKTLILGAGAIGGYIGGRLHQSGADVTFLVRPARREALQRDGLVIRSPKGDITQTVKTVRGGAEGGPYDLVLLTCKAYDLDSAIEAVAPAVKPGVTVVPLLNGMRHLDILDAKFGAASVAGGLARIGVAMSPKGEILHTSPFAAISFGERDGKPARSALAELDAAVKRSGLDGGLHGNIIQDLWDKWIMLCTLASMCCLMRGTAGDILEADEGQAIMLETVEECRKVAAAAGFDPGEAGMSVVRAFFTQKGSRFAASMLHDLEKGSMVEADHAIGDMIARARKAGIATPNLRLAYASLQVYLARRARGGIG